MIIMNNTPSESTLNSILIEYISLDSFEKRLISTNFIDGHVPIFLLKLDARIEFMSNHTYKTARSTFKSTMIPSAYKSLGDGYRSFQYKKLNNLVNINIERSALESLKSVQRKLGLDEFDNSFSDTIHWLSAPSVRRELETEQALFDAHNECEYIQFGDEPTASILRQVDLLKARMGLSDQKLLEKIIEVSFVSGWKAKKNTRSDAPERIKPTLEKDPLFKVANEIKSITV